MAKEIRKIPARELICPARLDIMAKYIYIEAKENNYDMSYAKELYKAHIEAFSDGTYAEPRNDDKNSLDVFFDTFDKLIESIKENGLDEKLSVVPVSSGGIIQNGAHRVAVAAYYDLEVPCISEPNEQRFDYKFFREKLLDKKYLDCLATRYIEWTNRDVNILILWPAAFRDRLKYEQAVKYLDQEFSGRIIYESKQHLGYNGLRNFMIYTYAGGYDWAGTIDDHFSGIQTKVDECYDRSELIQSYAIEADAETVRTVKEQLRDIFGSRNDSCHSTDTKAEAIELAHLLFNGNSMDALNNGRVDFDVKLYNRVEQIKQVIAAYDLDMSRFIIGSISVMGIYGLKTTEDIGIVMLAMDEIPSEIGACIDDPQLYEADITSLLFDPDKYLYSCGMKFITLKVLKKFLIGSGMETHSHDLKLIDSKLKQKPLLRDRLQKSINSAKRSFRNFKVRARNWFQKRNIYVFTKIWHFIKGKGFK